jgi:hypothetical protein
MDGRGRVPRPRRQSGRSSQPFQSLCRVSSRLRIRFRHLPGKESQGAGSSSRHVRSGWLPFPSVQCKQPYPAQIHRQPRWKGRRRSARLPQPPTSIRSRGALTGESAALAVLGTATPEKRIKGEVSSRCENGEKHGSTTKPWSTTPPADLPGLGLPVRAGVPWCAHHGASGS